MKKLPWDLGLLFLSRLIPMLGQGPQQPKGQLKSQPLRGAGGSLPMGHLGKAALTAGQTLDLLL